MDFGSDTQFQSLRCPERLKTRPKRKFEQLEILITWKELLAIWRSLHRRVKARGQEVADSNLGAATMKGEVHRNG